MLKIRFEEKFELHVDLEDADLKRYKIVPLTLVIAGKRRQAQPNVGEKAAGGGNFQRR
ncbi:MAG: hypothetical protein IPL27_20665 [Lewinellaceae bacterium]|nr:hypothetical protein [Lewinellaceae bacterium]